MDNSAHKKMPRSYTRIFCKVAFGVVLLLVVLRLAAPFVIQRAVNLRLQKIPEYSGHVDSIELSIWRGAYRLYGFYIEKRQGQRGEPFFTAKLIDFSVAWRDVFKGKLVSDIYIEDCRLTFLNSSTAAGSQLETDRRWQDVIQDLFPFEITHCEISRGILRYVDVGRTPKVDISIKDLRVLATGLRNRRSDGDEAFPAHINLNGTVFESGQLEAEMELEPLSERPHFMTKIEAKNVELNQVNDFLRAFGHVDVSSGTLQLYFEAKAQDGTFDGYIKPFFQNLNFSNVGDKYDNIGKRIWESMVSFVATLVKNHRKDQLATQIPFSGKFDNPSIGVFATIVNTIENGFGHALSHGFNTDNVVSPEKIEKLSKTKG